MKDIPTDVIQLSLCRTCGHNYPQQHKKCKVCRKVRREEIATIVKKWKNRRCVHCGIKYHHSAMQCDHVRGDKIYNIADAARLQKSDEDVVAELNKCDIVCANCHSMKSYTERRQVSPYVFFSQQGLVYYGFRDLRRLSDKVRKLGDVLGISK